MKLRVLGVAATALVAATTLSACHTNVGFAASVNGHEISESQLDGYLLPDGPNTAAKTTLQNRADAIAKQSGQSAQQVSFPAPRTFVLETLIREQVLANILDARGGKPSNAALDKVGASLDSHNGADFRRVERLEAKAAGAHSTLATHLEREQELITVLAQRVSNNADLRQLIDKFGGHVRVNPRYGTWNPSQVSISDGRSAGLPGYLTLQPTASS